MDVELPDDDINLTTEETIQLIMNSDVEFDFAGSTYEVSIPSERIPITKLQAEILVDALSGYEDDKTANVEAAHRTQTLLREKFDID